MSKTPDKRRRGDLELFVLALIDDGVSTPYALQRAAGLSPGATIPVLRRLLQGGLVLVGKSGARGRMAHKLSTAGRQRLKVGWKELVAEEPSCNLDADLRVALLALFVGGSRRSAVDFLRKSAARNLESLRSIEDLDSSAPLTPLALQYKKLRAASAKALIKAEAAAMISTAQSLARIAGPGQPRDRHPKSRVDLYQKAQRR